MQLLCLWTHKVKKTLEKMEQKILEKMKQKTLKRKEQKTLVGSERTLERMEKTPEKSLFVW